MSVPWLATAEQLRAQGASYAYIGGAVGRSAVAVFNALNPDKRRLVAARARRKPSLPLGPITPCLSTSAAIIRAVAERHHLEAVDLRGEVRHRPIVWARQEACYRLRAETRLSLEQIGLALGGRDHTTVLHGVRKHAARAGLPVPPAAHKGPEAYRAQARLEAEARAC